MLCVEWVSHPSSASETQLVLLSDSANPLPAELTFFINQRQLYSGSMLIFFTLLFSFLQTSMLGIILCVLKNIVQRVCLYIIVQRIRIQSCFHIYIWGNNKLLCLCLGHKGALIKMCKIPHFGLIQQ